MSDLSNSFVIGDENWQNESVAVVDGHGFGRGLVQRDYGQFPHGCYKSAPPFSLEDMPVIPMEEWPERIAEMERTKSRLSDIRDVANNGQSMPSLDQNGQGYCVTSDSEYLTLEGWVSVSEYDGSKAVATIDPATNRMEYQFPTIVHQYEYDGEMLYSTNRRIDFGVTPNHRMYVRRWDEKSRKLATSYSFVQAKDIGWYSGLLAAPTPQIGTHIEELAVPGFAAFSGDDFFAMLGLIVSDGFAGGSEKNQNVVSFASFRSDEKVKELAVRCGFRPKESNPSVWICTSHEFAKWVRENCYCGSELGAANKCVPRLVKAATPRQIKIFLEYFDDRNRDSTQFYSGSRRLIDDLQELHLLIGVRSTIGKRDPRTSRFPGNKSGEIRSKLPQYVLTVSTTERLCIDKKKHIESDRYKGMVYCVTVPNGTIVTRRNGSVLFSGNCWAYSTTSCVQLLRARANLPYVPLSGHSVACVIKNFRDQGGWGAASLDFVTERGIMPQSIWPAKSMSRQHNTPDNWDIAQEYRVSEAWVELSPPVYARDMSVMQVGTCLLNRIPVIGDYNWWRHSVALMDLVDVYPSRPARDPRRYGCRILNSWTDRWGERGTSVLKDSKAFPDGGAAPRVPWGG